MTKIIVLVVLSVALSVNAGPFRGRNVDIPVDLVKEPITVELLKEEIIIPIDQLRVAEEVNIQEPVAVISEKIVNNEENRVETVVLEEIIAPQLKVEAVPEKIEAVAEPEPTLIEVVETVKLIAPAVEPASIETVLAPVEAQQKVEILEAAEPAVKTVVAEEEQVKTELKQEFNPPPQSPGLLGVVQNFIQNNPLNPVNLLNRASTSAPPKADDDSAAVPAPVSPGQQSLVQQIQTGLQTVQQTIANTLSGNAPSAAPNADGTPVVPAPARPTLLQNIQTAINNVLRPGQAAADASPAAASVDASGAAPAESVTAELAAAPPAPATPIQQFVATVQNLLAPRPANVVVAVVTPAKPAEAVGEKSVETVEEVPVKIEEVPVKIEEEPAKEQ